MVSVRDINLQTKIENMLTAHAVELAVNILDLQNDVRRRNKFKSSDLSASI